MVTGLYPMLYTTDMPKKQKSQKSPATKKKQSQEPEEDKSAPSIVTQVVEVVEISEPETQSDAAGSTEPAKDETEVPAPAADESSETKTDESDTESPASAEARDEVVIETERPEVKAESESEDETTYEEVSEDDRTPEKKSGKPVPDESLGKQKQVVEELFSKREAGSLTEISVSGKRKRPRVFLWAAVVVVAALTTGVGLILFSGKQPANLAVFPAKATPTPTPAPTAAPTPVPDLKREDITVQVLNGGGVAGAAGKMKTFLTDKGYQVTDLGNTDEYSYKDTEILVKPSKSQALSLLQSDLKSDYTLGTASATLPDDVSYDARVIVGSE